MAPGRRRPADRKPGRCGQLFVGEAEGSHVLRCLVGIEFGIAGTERLHREKVAPGDETGELVARFGRLHRLAEIRVAARRQGDLIGGGALHALPGDRDRRVARRVGDRPGVGSRQLLGHLRLVGTHHDDIVDIDAIPCAVERFGAYLDPRLVRGVLHGEAQRLPLPVSRRGLRRQHRGIDLAVEHRARPFGRNEVGSLLVVETQEIDRHDDGLRDGRQLLQLGRHDPAAVVRHTQLHIARVFVNALPVPLLHAAVDAVLLGHRLENVVRTVRPGRDHIRFGRLRTDEVLAGRRRTVGARSLPVVGVVAAPDEQVEAHAEQLVRRIDAALHLALELHFAVERKPHPANQIAERGGRSGDRHRNRAAAFALDLRLESLLDPQSVRTGSCERSLDEHPLAAERLVVNDIERSRRLRARAQRSRNHRILDREAAVGLRYRHGDLAAGRFQIKVAGALAARIALRRNGHILIIPTVAHAARRRDREPGFARLSGGVGTLRARLPGPVVPDRDTCRGIRVIRQLDRVGVAPERRRILIVGTGRERTDRQGEHHAHRTFHKFHTQFD